MSSIWLNAQHPVYQTYTVDNGLPSNTIYKIDQDSKGNIWLATGTGASRYNGTSFKNFDSSDGLGDIFGLSIDANDRVWVWNNKTYFSYCQNDKVYHTDSIPYLNKKFPSIPNSILIDTATVSILTQDMSLAKFDVNSLELISVTKPEEHKVPRSHVYLKWFKYLGFPQGYFKNKWFCSDTKRFKLQSKIMQTGIFTANGPNHWVVNTDGTGVHLVAEEDSCLVVIKTFLKDKKINTAFEDRSGNLWIGSQSDGLFFLPNKSVLSYDIKDGLSDNSLFCIEQDENNRIFLGNDISIIDILDPADNSIKSIKLENKSARLYDMDYSSNKRLWAVSEVGTFIIQNDKIFNSGNQNRVKRPDKAVFQENDSTYWFGSSNYVYKCKLDTITGNLKFTETLNPSLKKKSYAVYASNDSIWLGTARGLYLYYSNNTDSTEIYYGEKNKLLSSGIRDIEKYNNQLWIATVNNGVYVFENDSIVKHINKDTYPLSSNSCTELFIDTLRNSIWVAGKRGVTKIDNPDNLDSLKFDIFDTYDGLIGNEATDILIDREGRTWITTKSGLTVFKIEDLESKPKPNINITNVRIWGKDTILQNNYKLPSNKNDIGFKFESIYFNSPTHYKYKLFGRDEDWTITQNNEVRYSRLSAGKYKFEVAAVNQELVESEKNSIVEFEIALPLWKKKWFILLCLATLFFLGYLIIKNRINQVKRESKLTELSLRGVRNQMNAHFLFNALNSIQSYVLKSDAKTAYQYLTKLSKLIRQSLYHSNQKNISLEEEINLLTNYIDLEKLK